MLAPLVLTVGMLLSGPIQKDSDVVEFEIKNEQVDRSYLVVETPSYSGQFDVTIEHPDRPDIVSVHLVGTIDHGIRKEHSIQVDIRLTYPLNQNAVERVGNARMVHSVRGTELFITEKLAPVSSEWSYPKHPEFGYLQIWDVENPDKQLTDSIIVSLYHDMIGLDGEVDIQGSECDPTFEQCLTSAINLCGSNRVGSLSYSCNEGTVSCSFTCLQSPPG